MTYFINCRETEADRQRWVDMAQILDMQVDRQREKEAQKDSPKSERFERHKEKGER